NDVGHAVAVHVAHGHADAAREVRVVGEEVEQRRACGRGIDFYVRTAAGIGRGGKDVDPGWDRAERAAAHGGRRNPRQDDLRTGFQVPALAGRDVQDLELLAVDGHDRPVGQAGERAGDRTATVDDGEGA